MDSQSWASALKQVKGTLGKWPILVLLPVSLILPRYPEPWGSSLTLLLIGICIGNSIRYALQVHRILKQHAEAERIERQCRLELIALTMQIDPLMRQHLELLQQGRSAEAEQTHAALEEIYAEQQRVMEKWKRSETPDTK